MSERLRRHHRTRNYWSRRRSSCAAGFFVVLLATGSGGPTAGAMAGDDSDDLETTPLDAVVLVDESGSLTAADMAQEQQAVSIIAQGMLNPRSRITVVGFGSSNAPGQTAVDIVCPPIVLSSVAAKNSVDECAAALKIRSSTEGNDTDHASALSQGLTYFPSGGPEGAARVIFLLTDGNLDVLRSPQWGQIPSTRNDSALEAARQQLKRAKELGVQIWPLGFGQSIDRARLDEFAAGGATSDCIRPTARLVEDGSAVVTTLFDVFASASCGVISPPQTIPVPAEVPVTVPEIATDGSIIVAKSDPRLTVRFKTPDGSEVPSSGEVDGSEVLRSGQGQSVESLRIVNPATGQWTVTVDAAPGSPPGQTVTVMALWQGAVRASLYSEPPVASPGQDVVVHVQINTRQGPITSPASLSGVEIGVTASDPDSTDASNQLLDVRDDGAAPDTASGDGVFSGILIAPSEEGTLQLEASVEGPGINATPIPMTLEIGRPGGSAIGSITIAVPKEVEAGRAIGGVVGMLNDEDATISAKLLLDGDANLASVQSPSALAELSVGETEVPFDLQFSQGRTGQLTAFLVLQDAADPQRVYATLEFSTVVIPAPDWLDRNGRELWFVVAAAAVALVLFVAWRRARARRSDVSGLALELLDPDNHRLQTFPAPSKTASRWDFYLLPAEREETDSSRLSQLDASGRGMTLTLRRLNSSQVQIRGKDSYVVDAVVAGPAVPVNDEYALRVIKKGRSSPLAGPRPSSGEWDTGAQTPPSVRTPEARAPHSPPHSPRAADDDLYFN